MNGPRSRGSYGALVASEAVSSVVHRPGGCYQHSPGHTIDLVAAEQSRTRAESQEGEPTGFCCAEGDDPAANIGAMTAKEKLRARVEDLTEREAEATLEFIASRGQSFGDWLDSRPEDDEPLSPEEQAALAASDADIAAGRTVSYAQVKQGLEAE
jgi:hypothetical protein